MADDSARTSSVGTVESAKAIPEAMKQDGEFKSQKSEKRPKPPPKPKPFILRDSPTEETNSQDKKSNEPVTAASTKVKATRPALPVRPRSNKKLEQTTNKKASNTTCQASVESPSVEEKQKTEEMANSSKKEMLQSQIKTDTEEKSADTEEKSADTENDPGYSILASPYNEAETKKLKCHQLTRTMSGPVSQLEKEILEKKRSISMRKEEEMSLPKPMPKPRTFSKMNKNNEKGRPIPPPRSKKTHFVRKQTLENTIAEQSEFVDKQGQENRKTKEAVQKEEVAKTISSIKEISEMRDDDVQNTSKINNEKYKSCQPAEIATEIELTESQGIAKEEELHEILNLESAPEEPTEKINAKEKVSNRQSKNHGYENVALNQEDKSVKDGTTLNAIKQKVNPYENLQCPIKQQVKTVIKQDLGSPGKNSDFPKMNYENLSLNMKPDTKPQSVGEIMNSVETVESSNCKTDLLDFKHFRIDADDDNDSDNEYVAPLKDLHVNDDVYSVPSTQKFEDLNQESYYQSPKGSPKCGVKKSLFNNTGPISSEKKDIKRIRRPPPPRPPMLDKNYNVLRSKSKAATSEHMSVEEAFVKQSSQQDIQGEEDGIYTTPTTDVTGEQSFAFQNVTTNDEISDHIYKEPCVTSLSSPIKRRSSDISNSSNLEIIEPQGHNEYVEPNSLSKAEGVFHGDITSQLRNSYTETDSTGSTRSSIALNNIDDSEYMEMIDNSQIISQKRIGDLKDSNIANHYVNMADHSPSKEIKEWRDSSEENDGDYVDMTENSPSVSPTKEIRPISNVYLQPLTKSEHAKKHPMILRPAPPPPPNRPVRKLPLPPTPPAKDDLSTGSDSLEGHYERIRSLRREMGLSVSEIDEDFSDSESESEDEEGAKEVNEMPDDGKERGKLYYIANEILTTEKTFVNALKLVCDDFGTAVKEMLQKDPSALPKNAYGQMFSDIELIYELDKKFFQELEERMKEWDKHLRIGDIIREFSHFLKMYTNYIKGYDKAMAVFQDNFLKMPKFTALVKEYEKQPSFKNLKITAYMLKPIQRIPSYRLLLADYLKHLPTDNEDYEDITNGLRIVSTVANHINESMKEGDKFQAMLKLQGKIINNKEIVKPGRYLLKEGVLYKLSRKEAQARMFVLLTDCLFYCEPAAGHNQYKLRQELPLAGMSLVVPDTIDFIKELTIISTKRSFTLVASTPEERDEWATAIKNAIEDVSRRIVTFSCKLEHSDKPSSTLSPSQELGRIAPRWVPDDRATMCSICCRRFTTYNRRHHCRACGEIVCKDCSSFEAPLHYLDLEPARVCEKCYHHLYNSMIDESLTQDVVDGTEESSGTKLKRSRSAISGKFRVIKKPKRDRKERKTLPSKLTEVSVHEQDKNVSGYLWVLKKKKQKRRWFVLKDHVLYAYKAPSDPAANSTVPVLGYKVKITGNFDADDFVFQLEHQGLKEPLVYKADSRVSADKWVSSLCQASELTIT